MLTGPSDAGQVQQLEAGGHHRGQRIRPAARQILRFAHCEAGNVIAGEARVFHQPGHEAHKKFLPARIHRRIGKRGGIARLLPLRGDRKGDPAAQPGLLLELELRRLRGRLLALLLRRALRGEEQRCGGGGREKRSHAALLTPTR